MSKNIIREKLCDTMLGGTSKFSENIENPTNPWWT